MLIETTYQPFVSFFHQTGIVAEHPQFAGFRELFVLIPQRPSFYFVFFAADFASAIAIELRRGSPPDVRDFLRFKFKNGTAGDFKDIHVFGHHADVPLTEFIYRAEVRN